MTVARVLLLVLFLCPAAHADWFTLAGDPSDGNSDYIQTDPASVKVDGGKRLVGVRVSRAGWRTSTDGVRFRSFEGLAEVDCVQRTARYRTATFFAAPHFAGEPVKTLSYSSEQERPVAFRQISGEFDQRLIRAACVVEGR